MSKIAAVAIVGAGPYGLSIAAHLSAEGVEPLVFGPPMASWRDGMPRGMKLKSEGFASTLFDPERRFTLKTYCDEAGLAYADIERPVPVEMFTTYGEAFQKRFVPQVDTRMVAHVGKAAHGFTLRLEDGTRVDARRVIVATGIGPYRHVPEELRGLSRERVTHTCEHADYGSFAGQKVVVVGAGASAVDAAAALYRGGATVSLVSRRASVRFYAGGNPRGWRERLAAPMTPLGPGWKKLFCVKAPLLFRALPERLRNMIVRKYLGPAPGWFARSDFEGKVTLVPSSNVVGARETAAGVELKIARPDGRVTLDTADHVVAGTGYRVDVQRLTFLDPGLVAAIDLNVAAPKLSSRFETSVRGLYFVGTASAYEFGPMLRFVCGAGFTARRITGQVVAAERKLARAAVDRLQVGDSHARLEGTPVC